MEYVEKCDMVWGVDGNPMLLSSEFERRLEDEGLMTKRPSRVTSSSRQTSSLQRGRRSLRGSGYESVDSVSSNNETNESEGQATTNREADNGRRRLVNDAGRRIKRLAHSTGEIGLKLVALPTFVLLDMMS